MRVGSRFDCEGDTRACVRVLLREGGVWVSAAQVNEILRSAPVKTRIAGRDPAGRTFVAIAR